MHASTTQASPPANSPDASGWDLPIALARRWRMLTLAPLLAGALTYGYSLTIPPTFTARTSLLPPQQNQGSMASALASLGSLASLAGGAAGIKTPADQYVSLLLSQTLSDRIIARYELAKVYQTPLKSQTRKTLAAMVRIAIGKKDGLITIEVDDQSPERAANIANSYVEELRRLTGELAITEAQQRRVFFERQMTQTHERLVAAQKALQGSGVGLGAMKAEPKAAADSYAKLQAMVTSAEVRLQTLRASLSDTSAEVQQATSTLMALKAELARLEDSNGSASKGDDYVGRYREFKYQETLFELFAKQYEVARVDESREGALIQVVDAAAPPDRKSKPARALMAVAGTLIAFIALTIWVTARHAFLRSQRDEQNRQRWTALKAAFFGRSA